MPIPFTCPHCGVHTNVADHYAGQTGPCSACGQTITIPGATTAYSSNRPQRSSGPGIAVVLGVLAVVVLFCGGVLVALFLPAVSTSREAARQMQCSNHLKQIAIAMHNYHDVHGGFPAAVVANEQGEPMQSWRLALTPYVESRIVYDAYDFDEPWDSPTNQGLEAARPPVYSCPSDPAAGAAGPFETSYVMIVGKGTVGGEANEFVTSADITDGTSNTIMAIEVAGSGIHWMEPRDMTVDEAVAYITSPEAAGQFHAHQGGVNVAMADGSVHFVAKATDPQVVRSMLIRDDGQ